MKRPLFALLGLAAAASLVTAQNPEVNTRTIECADSNPPFVGYDRMQDIVNDQFEEFQRIENGMAPRPPYVFRLCPNTEFDMSTPLTVLLSDSMFLCGPNIASTDNCIFKGGNENIKIERMALDGYAMERTTFIGIIFDAFTGTSVEAFGVATSTASFVDCIWQNFQASFVVKIGVEIGVAMPAEQMRVEISGRSVVMTGNAGTYFANDGGILAFDDVRLESLQGVVSFYPSTRKHCVRPSFLLSSDATCFDLAECNINVQWRGYYAG
jgi:hypothetical protein